MDFYVTQESQASLCCTCAAIHLQQIKKLHCGGIQEWWKRIALYFIISAPAFKRAFGKANCRVLICLVLY